MLFACVTFNDWVNVFPGLPFRDFLFGGIKGMIHLTRTQDSKIFTVDSDLEHGYVSEFSRAIQDELKEKDDLSYVIDLDKCNFIDSGNLGVISQANRELTSRGLKLKLINVRKGVAATLSVTSFDKILEIELVD